MHTDGELLIRYAAHGDEPAFGELIARHLNLVYSAALRQTRTPAAAEDVAQQVFADLARKAGRIPQTVPLAAWLHRATRFVASQQRRTEQRRAAREQESHVMQQRDHGHPEPAWEEVRELLDESLDDLPAEDRNALLLRYFEQRSFADVGAAMGATGEAARKRVDRALDRLRDSLARRGITTTAAALGGALTAHAVQIAPAGLAATLASGSLAAAGAGGLSPLTFLASMKTKTLLVGTAVSAALIAPIAWQENALAKAREEHHALTRELNLPAESGSVSPDSLAERERNELARLPQEAADLRRRLEELNRQFAAAAGLAVLASEPTSPAQDTIDMDVASLRDAGQATPVALLETHLWATLHGDTNRLAQLMAISPEMDPRLMEDRLTDLQNAAADGPEALLAASPFQGLRVGLRVLEEQPAEGPADRWIVNEFVIHQGDFRGSRKNRMLVRLTGTGWRLVLGLDGNPIAEEVPHP